MSKSTKPPFNKVCIIGVGLLGSSLILSMKKNKIAKSIFGICRSTKSFNLLKKLNLGCRPKKGIDASIIGDADLVILCSSVQSIQEMILKVRPMMKRGSILMDIGSTKRAIIKASKKSTGEAAFVGAHPIAGSEHKGPQYGRADLFSGALCILSSEAETKAARRCEKFWKMLGSHSVYMNASEHDKAMSGLSHLPHLASSSLLISLCKQMDSKTISYSGSGLAGMVRIAGANPGMWKDILASNGDNIKNDLKRYIAELTKLSKILDKKNNSKAIEKWLNGAAEFKSKKYDR